MTTASSILKTHPDDLGGVDRALLASCIEACFDCAQACTTCADACLGEGEVANLIACVRANLDCADVCGATGRVLSRSAGYDTDVARAMLQACVSACRACGDECADSAGLPAHSRVCAEVCRRCEEACAALLSALA